MQKMTRPQVCMCLLYKHFKHKELSKFESCYGLASSDWWRIIKTNQSLGTIILITNNSLTYKMYTNEQSGTLNNISGLLNDIQFNVTVNI